MGILDELQSIHLSLLHPYLQWHDSLICMGGALTLGVGVGGYPRAPILQVISHTFIAIATDGVWTMWAACGRLPYACSPACNSGVVADSGSRTRAQHEQANPTNLCGSVSHST